jgi:POT family proton-dependent oligopeptide transporter
MIAILALFLQTKFGLTGPQAILIYSVFYAALYALSLVGGLIADKTRNYKNTIFIGLVVMAIGYLLLSIPTPTPVPNKTLGIILSCGALFVIAFGNGLFKGNLQAVVGQMYDNKQYEKMRDSGFSMFYAFINIGAMFSPFVASGVRNWWVKHNKFAYDANLPMLCHQQLDGTITAEGTANLTRLAAEVSPAGACTADLTAFAGSYLNIFTEGFHYAFIAAIVAMLISTVVYLVNRKGYPDPKDKALRTATQTAEIEMSVKEIRQRIWALMGVFSVVIFFWYAFNQSGALLTLFARDYVELSLFGWSFSVEIFQSVNPVLVVFLTPIIVSFYGWLRAKNMEPSTPKKIVFGMGIAAAAYGLLLLVSYMTGLPDFSEVQAAGVSPVKVSAWVLIGTYFLLTVAELFISPLGISFVSKVAPPHLQGLMQGGWLTAAGIGNFLLFLGVIFYESLPVWATWSIFVSVLLLAMLTMLSMVKWLERVAK